MLLNAQPKQKKKEYLSKHFDCDPRETKAKALQWHKVTIIPLKATCWLKAELEGTLGGNVPNILI